MEKRIRHKKNYLSGRQGSPFSAVNVSREYFFQPQRMDAKDDDSNFGIVGWLLKK